MRAARIDRNQPEIVKGLREAGATVQILSTVGQGCPDILVGYCGGNYLFEIKDGDKVPSQRKLTPMESKWHREWDGQVCIIDNLYDAFDIIGVVSAN